MNRIAKKYIACLIFSFDLFVLVWFSEILHNIMLAVSSGWSSGIFVLMLYSVLVFFLFVFGIVPLCLLGMWLINPLAIEKLFTTFGLTEKSLDKKKKKPEKET